MASDQKAWYQEIVLPVLLDEGRKTYGKAIRSALAAAGFDDMPRAGARIVGGIAREGINVRDVAQFNGVSKQAASKLVDTLVLRGYLERVPDEADRRRTSIGLTERGRAAAHEVRSAVEQVDARLAAAIGADGAARLRAALGALISLAPAG